MNAASWNACNNLYIVSSHRVFVLVHPCFVFSAYVETAFCTASEDVDCDFLSLQPGLGNISDCSVNYCRESLCNLVSGGVFQICTVFYFSYFYPIQTSIQLYQSQLVL